MIARPKIISFLLVLTLLYFSWLMAKITIQYIPYNTDIGFLMIKQQYIHIDHWRIAFFIHVYTSMATLAAGFTQFFKFIQTKYPKLHRVMGYVYIINILCITGPAGLLMGFYANGGLWSRVGFILLALLWIYFTFKSLMYAQTGNFKQHRYFIIRSYALTLSAISLRSIKYLITNLYHVDSSLVFPPMDVYRIVAWAGWLMNLIIAEYIIYSSNRNSKKVFS